jgi:putative membrane protein
MTLLLRIALEMLVLGGAAPLLARALGGGRWHRAGALGTPAVGLAALTGILAAVQAPAVVEAASRSWAFSALTLLAFLTAAVLFWWPVLRPAAEGGISPIAKIGYLLIAGVPVTIPGVILAFSPRLLYPGARAAGAFGLTPLADQQLAGLVLFGGAKVILVGLTFVILWRMLAAADPPDEGWDEAGRQPAPLPAPDWYRRLEQDLPAEPAPTPARGRRLVPQGSGLAPALSQTRGQG